MSLCAESLRRILAEPLDYVHPQRLSLASTLDTSVVRKHINQLLSQQLCSLDSEQRLSPVARSWVEHWRLLPDAAALIGAYLAWPHLAAGGRLTHLPKAQRQFAALRIAPRLAHCAFDGLPLPEQLQALGLNALLGAREQVPQALSERLALQFPVAVVARQHDLPPASLDAALFRLAIQHARFHSNTD
ncbi:hypothetical protein ACIPL1_02450 [Pseudomonas sp. NPDC090202]|uniref:hypothetical protein n=1 Tax=unclassified Pseudomonas TaxID=196821 RepID=UPI00382A0FED